MTMKGRDYPTRIHCTFKGEHRQVVLDQINTINQVRFVRKIDWVDKKM
jgi:mRNA interferase MazF